MAKLDLSSTADETTRVLRVRVKDRFDKVLTHMAQEVNLVWNDAKELSLRV